MSRSGYSDYDDCEDQWAMIRWSGAVKSAIRGRRGQEFLRELAASLDAMPEKALIAEELEQDGAVCALGAVGKIRGIDMSKIDPEDWDAVAALFGINEKLAREIMFVNDDWAHRTDPHERWRVVRAWVTRQIGSKPPSKNKLDTLST